MDEGRKELMHGSGPIPDFCAGVDMTVRGQVGVRSMHNRRQSDDIVVLAADQGKKSSKTRYLSSDQRPGRMLRYLLLHERLVDIAGPGELLSLVLQTWSYLIVSRVVQRARTRGCKQRFAPPQFRGQVKGAERCSMYEASRK